MERLKRYSSWLVVLVWILLAGAGIFIYMQENTRNKEQENILVTEIQKANKLSEETQKLRPVWTSLLAEIKNMMHDIEGRQRLIIENQDSFKQRDRDANEMLRSLQKRQEELVYEIAKMKEAKDK